MVSVIVRSLPSSNASYTPPNLVDLAKHFPKSKLSIIQWLVQIFLQIFWRSCLYSINLLCYMHLSMSTPPTQYGVCRSQHGVFYCIPEGGAFFMLMFLLGLFCVKSPGIGSMGGTDQINPHPIPTLPCYWGGGD